jgi:ABC-type hemin transport system ATPase subunit
MRSISPSYVEMKGGKMISLQLRDRSYSSNQSASLANERKILAQINFCRFLFRIQQMVEKGSVLESNLVREKLSYAILKVACLKITTLK